MIFLPCRDGTWKREGASSLRHPLRCPTTHAISGRVSAVSYSPQIWIILTRDFRDANRHRVFRVDREIKCGLAGAREISGDARKVGSDQIAGDRLNGVCVPLMAYHLQSNFFAPSQTRVELGNFRLPIAILGEENLGGKTASPYPSIEDGLDFPVSRAVLRCPRFGVSSRSQFMPARWLARCPCNPERVDRVLAFEFHAI